MGNKQDRFSLSLEVLKLAVALGLEEHVSHRQCLVHDQDLRIDIDGNCEGKPDKHAAGIALDRLIDIITDIREINDRLKPLVDLFLREPDHGPVEVDILNAGIFHVEACAEFQERADASVHLDLPRGGCQNARDQFEHGGLSRTIGSDDAHGLSLFDFKVNMAQRMFLFIILLKIQSQRFPQTVSLPVVQAVDLRDVLHADRQFISGCFHLFFLSHLLCSFAAWRSMFVGSSS